MTRRWIALLLPAALGACASLPPPPAPLAAQAPAAWQAPLPHGGKPQALANWWQEQGDALLAELVKAAQDASPSLASARARVLASRTQRSAAGAALMPNVELGASSVQTRAQGSLPQTTSSQASLGAAWEIDLFGANRAARDAAQARLEAAEAEWHLARVSVAAETANVYEDLKTCLQLLRVARADAASRAETARLTSLAAKAGLQSPATAAMADASAADGASRARAQQTQCEASLQGLAVLSAIEAPRLAQRLQQAGLYEGKLGSTTLGQIAPETLPAATLAQRPDVYAAERAVAAAAADIGSAAAAQYPRLSLQGSVGVTRTRAAGVTLDGDTWSLGPLALSLPVFDGGRRAANEQAARAAYEAAASAYRASVRQAVREVEDALRSLDATGARSSDAERALAGYRTAFGATEARYREGMASLFELEDARRALLGAETAVISLQRERSAAWISLYRAAGGGWSRQP